MSELESSRITPDRFQLASIPAYGWVIVAMSVLGLGVLPWIIGKPHVTAVAIPSTLETRILPTDPGDEHFPALSPDGRQVAYVWENESGQVDLYVRMVDAEHHIQLTDSAEIEESPAWAPDGRVIAYFSRTGPGLRTLRLVAPQGGRIRDRGTVEVPVQIDVAPDMSTGPAWFPDGEWVAFGRKGSEPDSMELVALSLARGDMVRLTRPPAGTLDHAPAVSPDGNSLAFTRSAGQGLGGLHITSIDLRRSRPAVPEARKLPAASTHDTDAAWSLDGRSLLFSAGYSPDSRLWTVAVDGIREPAPLSAAGAGGSSPSLALALLPDHEAPVWRMVYASSEGGRGSLVLAESPVNAEP